MLNISLKVKILFSVSLIILVVMGTNAWVYTQKLQRNYLEALGWRSEALAQEIVNDLVKRYGQGLVEADKIRVLLEVQSIKCEQLYKANESKQVVLFAVIDEAGVIAAHNDSTLRNTPIKTPVLIEALERRAVTTVLADNIYHTLVPVFPVPEVYLGTIDVGIPAQLMTQKVRELLMNTISLFVLLVVLACSATFVLVHIVVTKPINRLVSVARKIAKGEVTQTISVAKGSDEIAALTNAFRDMIIYLKNMADAATRIAAGDLSQDLTPRSDADQLGQAFQSMRGNLKTILHEVERLIQAVQAGQLSIRSNIESFTGEWRGLVVGLNNVLDAFVGPITMTADYLDRIAKGDIPESITTEYNGDFNAIKDNLNMLIAAMNDIARLANEMATGNLLVEVRERSERDTLMQALNTMSTRLKDVVTQVKLAADTVTSSSQQLNLGAEQMSQGASQQAAAAEEASASMQQMAANIRQNADNALQTEKIAKQSVAYAEEGGNVVAETVVAMQQITKKILIIQEIASQTRLLSLNATIEAARAQEHGKAFTVVASEVRKLADTTKIAAEEIDELASSSRSISERAGQMLSNLVPNIQRTAELVQEISAASSEQHTGTEQINRAIQQLDQVIQQNAATSEEMASTASQLANQAEDLQRAIAFFAVGDVDQEEKQGSAKPGMLKLANYNRQRKKKKRRHNKDRKTYAPTLTTGEQIVKPVMPFPSGDETDHDFERF